MTDFTSSDSALGLLAWLLTYLLHSTILIGGIWCVLRLRLIRSAGIEDVLWKIGLVGALLTATLQTGAGIEPVFGTYALAPDVRLVESSAEPIIDADIALGVLDVEGAPLIRFAFREAPVPRTRRLQVAPFEARGPASAGSDSGRAPVRLAVPRTADTEGTLRPALWPWSETATAQLAAPLTAPVKAPISAPLSAPAHLVSGLGETNPGPGSDSSQPQSAAALGSSGMSWLTQRWVAIAAGLWILLAAVGLRRYVHLRRRLLTALGTRKPVQSIRMLSILGRLEHRAGISGAVRLTCSPFLSGPVALGRREICVPSRAVTGLEPQQQEALLAHELAHIRRRDPQWLNLCAVLEAMFFFQPLNRMARSRLQACSEFLCDDWAVDSTGRRVTLAQCLAEVASWIEDTRDVLPVAGMARPDSSLLQRIRRIADRPPRQKVLRRSATTLLALALLGGVSCGVPGISSGLGEGSVLQQLQVFVRSAFNALSPAVASSEGGDSSPAAAPAASTSQDAPSPPRPPCEGETEAPAAPADAVPEATGDGAAPSVADPLVGNDRRSPFQRRLNRPGASRTPPKASTWPSRAPNPLQAPNPVSAPRPVSAPQPPSAPAAPSPFTDPSPPAASPLAPANPSGPAQRGARRAPVFVRRVSPPATPSTAPAVDPSEPLARFQQLFPSPARPVQVAQSGAARLHWPAADEDDDTIVLRLVDGQAVGVDSSGRTFRIVGVDQPGSSSTLRIELKDGKMLVVDGKGDTVVVLNVGEDLPGSDAAERDSGDEADALDLDLDRELRLIEREYESLMRDLDRTLSEVEREFELSQSGLSREFEAAVEQGQREYDAAVQEWTREYEFGSEEMTRVQERVLEEFERELREFQRELSDQPDALEEQIEEWEVRYSEWEYEHEDEWEDWERSIEEELESLEDEYELWWEEIGSDFESAFEELEEEYEWGMQEWEVEIQVIGEEYEAAFAEWEESYEAFADSFSGRDCDHDCESACANGCTHPEDEPDWDEGSDCHEQESPAEADAT